MRRYPDAPFRYRCRPPTTEQRNCIHQPSTVPRARCLPGAMFGLVFSHQPVASQDRLRHKEETMLDTDKKFRSSTFCLPVGCSAVLALMIALVAVPSFGSSLDTQSYVGTAYGTYATVGNTVLVGQTAPVTLGGTCGTSQQPANVPGTAAGVNAPPLVSGGAVNTGVSSSPNTSQAVADTVSISLLNGLITAQEIKAVSTTTMQSDGTFQVSAAGSTFTHLSVLGIPYDGTVPANTRIDLPLLGYVVLNEQTTNLSHALANLTVNMVHIHITTVNILGLQVGTDIVVSNATSGMLNVYAPAILSGQSFGTEVLGPLVASTPTAPVILPCLGTNGALKVNSLATVNLAGILSSGTVANTGESNLTQTKSSGQTTSTVQGLNLLNGLVTANVMTARVITVVNDEISVFSSPTDTFVGLAVAGHPEITDNVPYNTSIPLAGLGTLYLKRIIRVGAPLRSTEVRSLELVVNENNSYGLPIGLDVIVGDAMIQTVPDANPPN